MKEPAGHLPPVECQLVLGGMQPGCGPRNWLGEAEEKQNQCSILQHLAGGEELGFC